MSYAPPPPPGAELRLAEPWELCSPTASTKNGSMAADVRRWGGYCRRTSSIAAVTLGASGATLSTSTCLPQAMMAIRRPVDTVVCPTVRGSDTSLILLVLPDFCPLFGLDTM